MLKGTWKAYSILRQTASPTLPHLTLPVPKKQTMLSKVLLFEPGIQLPFMRSAPSENQKGDTEANHGESQSSHLGPDPGQSQPTGWDASN